MSTTTPTPEFDVVLKAAHGYESLVVRFWKSVDVCGVDECWVWTKSLTVRGGYGQLMWWDGTKRILVKAHRLSYELHFGPVPEGLMVCHRCGNQKCCNPHHLYAGTSAQTRADAEAHGTALHPPHVCGESCGKSKITDAIALSIKNSTETLSVLGDRYGLTKSAVSNIKRGITWKHLNLTL